MKRIVNNKSIILGVPDDFNLPENIKKNLEFIGFKVILLEYKTKKVKIPFDIEFKHLYNKLVKKDRRLKRLYRKRMEKKMQEDHFLFVLDSLKHKADYSLIIRPDKFTEKTLRKITEKSVLSAAYQWDGIYRFPFPKKYISFFDRFFLFDIDDIKIFPECLPTTNFYFDYFPQTPTNQENDVFFIGSYIPSRIESIEKISKVLHNLNQKMEVMILHFNTNVLKEYDTPYLRFTDKFFTFEQNIGKIRQSKILLDFKNSVHNGLSFRTFESIGFRKKLITNNELVKEYDFYHPSNIFVFDDDHYEGIEDFLKKPYVHLSEQIYEKYSFSNWIKYILNITPHIELRQEGM